MEGYVDMWGIVIGMIAVIVTAVIFQILPCEHMWKTIISISIGTMIIGTGLWLRVKYQDRLPW